MKRTVFLTILFTLTVVGLFAQTATLPRLAVAEFTVNDESIKTIATAVRNMVQSHMAGMSKYTMVTWDEIDLLLRNQQIQASSISSPENIQKLQRTNINYIVTGSVNVLFGEYTIIVSLLEVSSGESPFSARAESVGGSSREFTSGVTDMLNRFTGGMVVEGGQVVQKPNLTGKWVFSTCEIEFLSDGTFKMINFIKSDESFESGTYGGYREIDAYQGNINGTYSNTSTQLLIRGVFRGVRKKGRTNRYQEWRFDLDSEHHTENLAFSIRFEINGDTLIFSAGNLGYSKIVDNTKAPPEVLRDIVLNRFTRFR